MNCLICRENIEDGLLTKHLRSHKTTIKDYCLKYINRKCLYSGQPIEFINYKQYNNDIFANRNNMVLYLKKAERGEAEGIIKNLLGIRKIDKAILYLPGQTETRASEFIPSPLLCDQININYNQMGQQSGLKTRYNYFQKLSCHSVLKEELKIAVDNREQKDITISAKKIHMTLNVGDYTVLNQELFNNIYIDRKEPLDFIASMTSQIDRIKKELIRAREIGAYLIFLCEKPLTHMLNLENSDYYKRYTKVTGKYLFNNVKELSQEFPETCQFAFVPEGKKIGEFIKTLFLIKNDLRMVDLQFFIDKREL